MSSSVKDPTYRDVLKAAFESRCSKNTRYSLRAFARDLKISPARLSEIFNEKQGLSRARAEKIAKQLGLSTKEQLFFCDSVEASHSKSPFKRKAAAARVTHSLESARGTLPVDTFALISDWYHFAILELATIKGFKSDEGWIAKKLGVQKELTKLAIERLIRMDLLTVDQDGNWIASDDFTASPDGVPSAAIKKYHQQILEHAIRALYEQPINERDITNMILSFDRSQISQAKTFIRDFRRKFSKATGSPTTSKDTVYCLAVQFFRLDRDLPMEEK